MFGWRMFLAYDIDRFGRRLSSGPFVVEFPDGCSPSVLGLLGWSDRLGMRGEA